MYEVMVLASGDRAEHDSLEGALMAARTLVEDFCRYGRGASSRLVREGVSIYRDGQYDGRATALARGV